MENWTIIRGKKEKEVWQSLNNKCIAFVFKGDSDNEETAIAEAKTITQIFARWFELTDDLVPNAVLAATAEEMPSSLNDAHFAERTIEMFTLKMLPIRAHMTATESSNIFAPKLVLNNGEIRDLDFEELVDIVAEAGIQNEYLVADELKDISMKLFCFCRDYAEKRGVKISEAYYRFGFDSKGKLRLGGDPFTPNAVNYNTLDYNEIYKKLFS